MKHQIILADPVHNQIGNDGHGAAFKTAVGGRGGKGFDDIHRRLGLLKWYTHEPGNLMNRFFFQIVQVIVDDLIGQ